MINQWLLENQWSPFEDNPAYCWMFDDAIFRFGNHIEGKLTELDPFSHKPIYKLEYLLREVRRNPTIAEASRAMTSFNIEVESG